MIKDEDLRIERFNSGAGGQQQNKHPKNVRMTHLPSGTVVTMRGRNYHKNVAMAKKEMERRLKQDLEDKVAARKKSHRDEKIKEHRVVRTYDFTRQYARDDRTGTKLNLRKLMNGELDFREI